MRIAGHEREREWLRRLGERDALPQSYLFAGPRGVGKKLVAMEFARQLMVSGDASESLPQDLMLITPARETDSAGRVKRKKISVEQIRQATLFLSRYPALGRHRVVIIDEAEELSAEAGNALLKTLEEPNETSVLILVTHQPGRLLPTLLSRLVTVAFGTVPEGELRALVPPTRGIPDFFYHLGLPGFLVEAAAEPEIFRERQELLRGLFQVSRLSSRDRLRLAETLAEDEERLSQLLEAWLSGLHARLATLSGSGELKAFLKLFENLGESIQPLVRREGNTRLLLEKMLLSL